MVSIVSLCNRALAAIGTRSTIAALNEGSNEAIQCSLLYEPVRDQILGACEWGFANRTATLALLKEAVPGAVWTSASPPPPWQFSYSYPNDAVRILRVLPGDRQSTGSVPIFPGGLSAGYGVSDNRAFFFAIINDTDGGGNQIRAIATNVRGALVVYNALVTNPALWDDSFQEAFVLGLASRLAMPLTGDKVLANQKTQEANYALMEARAENGNQGLTTIEQPADWMLARNRSQPGFNVPSALGPLFSMF